MEAEVFQTNPRLRGLLLVLIFTFAASGIALAVFAQIQSYHRDQSYYATEAALPVHRVNQNNQNPSTSSGSSIGESETTNWKTYRNEELGFELSIPDTWEDYRVIEDSISIWFGIESISPRENIPWTYYLMIAVFDKQRWDECGQKTSGPCPYTNVIQEKNGKIYVYGFGTIEYPPDIPETDKLRPLFGVDKVISTFKFIQ